METTKILGAIGSAIGAVLAYDVAPILTLLLAVTTSILGGVIAARYVTLDVTREIDKAFAEHLEKFHQQQPPYLKNTGSADERRAPR